MTTSINTQQVSHILLSRTDNIGDVVLTLPMATLLKQLLPNCKISVLARHYVKAVVEACPSVDAFIDWNTLSLNDNASISRVLEKLSIDAIIHVFPNQTIAKCAKKAGINHRIGTSRRWYHKLYCNHQINFSRKVSNQHESELNVKLLQCFGFNQALTHKALGSLATLVPPMEMSDKARNFIKQDCKNIIVHPGSNGNTKEWPMTSFKSLIDVLPSNYHIILTGASNEREKYATLAKNHDNLSNSMGQLSLQELISLLAKADGMIANSTGPLHIAAALGTKSLGLYPKQTGMNVSRWGPVGQQVKAIESDRLCKDCCNKEISCQCMQSISVAQVKQTIESWF